MSDQVIKIVKCADPLAWYAKHIGDTFSVVRFEENQDPSQGIPEDVYWVRTGDAYNTLNYVRASDAKGCGEHLLDANARTQTLTGSEPAGPCSLFAVPREPSAPAPEFSRAQVDFLIAERDRLRAEVERLRKLAEQQAALLKADDKQADQLITERDAAESAADELASAVLGEPIDWPDHGAKWEEAKDVAGQRFSDNANLRDQLAAAHQTIRDHDAFSLKTQQELAVLRGALTKIRDTCPPTLAKPIGIACEALAATADDVGSPARYAQFVGRCDRSSVLAEKLCLRLASAWLHGNWKAETPAEAEMQEIMVKLGWWPITQQALLERAAAIDVAPSANG